MGQSISGKFRVIFYESVLLAILVGFVPELFYSGFRDVALVCPYLEMTDVKDSICTTISIQGHIQILVSFIIAVLASVAALVGAFGEYK